MGEVIHITDLAGEALRFYRETSERQLYRAREPKPGYFIAESTNVIQRAVEGGYRPVSFLMEESQVERPENAFALAMPDVPIYAAAKETLHSLVGFGMTRGVLALMERRELPKPDSLIEQSRRIAVLEDVMNPTNIGAIFRSAAALGVDAVLLTKGCSDPLYRRAARVSMGTVFQIPWTYVDAQWLDMLHAQGYVTAAMALREDTLALDDDRLDGLDKLAVVLGTEGEGLRDETIEACTYTVKIPMMHGVDSLNVAAASAVAFWQLCRGKGEMR